MAQTYLDKLKSPKWQKKRLEILERDEFTCIDCGSSDKNLQVHHTIYINDRNPWEYENFQLITLCEDCHEKFTSINKLIKVQISRFNQLTELQSINEILYSCSKLDPSEIDLIMDFSDIICECDEVLKQSIKGFISSYKQAIINKNDPNYF
ncbi:MAG TPA: HNH endonuclease [Paludibacter sp.]